MISETESDDLDAIPSRHQAEGRQRIAQKSPTPSAASSEDDLDPLIREPRQSSHRKQLRNTRNLQAAKVQWSGSEDERSTRRGKVEHAVKGESANKHSEAFHKDTTAFKRRTRVPKTQTTTGVGKAIRTKTKRPRQRHDVFQYSESVAGDGHGDDDSDLMPENIRYRRQAFDERAHRLREAGLALPPTYNEVYFSDNERMESLEERPLLPNVKPPAPYKDIEMPYSLGVIPAPIAQYLREYQVQGAAFLHELFVYQKGGILGDDMGLGKTIQVIAFLTAMYGKTGDERDDKRMRKMRKQSLPYFTTLIICPGSLMGNWLDELTRWGWWHAELYHGSRRDDVLTQAKAGMLEVMITTYTTYRLHEKDINSMQWDCVVADECHIIKEPKSEISKSMMEVNALCRIGLTGTAVQNKYEELWTLLNWTNPGRLGSEREWKQQVSEPLKLGQSHEATGQELAVARGTARLLVHNLLPQFLLRRMKSLIQDQLPKKTDRVIFCPLTEAQQYAYQNFIDSEYVQTIKSSTDDCFCPPKKGDARPKQRRKRGWCCYKYLSNGDNWQAWVFPCIMYLQKLSNHLALLIPSAFDASEKQGKDTELLSVAMPDDWMTLCDTRDSIMNFSNPEFCGKWRVLKKLLKFWHGDGDNKVLIFSHSVRLLTMLQQLLVHTKYNVTYLDGSLSYEERYQRVKSFNSNPNAFVFLISTRAGGVGLNITSANKVVIVDPNWNPSHDLQAQDRAYRIGQTRDVDVFRLVSQGTVEEVVYARQIYKQQQANISLKGTHERRYFEGVQGSKKRKGEIFGLANLFADHNENIVLRDIVHKTNVAEAKADLRITDITTNGNAEGENGDSDLSDSESRRAPRASQDDRIDPTINQIVESITGKAPKPPRAKRHDPVQAILASVGVTYTHENSEVIGESRVEVALSKRAADNTISQNTKKVFISDSQSQKRKCKALSAMGEEDEDKIHYVYRPPEDVRRRQFGAMARWAGYEDVVEFALVIEGYTQSQRRTFLDKWYRHRRAELKQASVEPTNMNSTQYHKDNANESDAYALKGGLSPETERTPRTKWIMQAKIEEKMEDAASDNDVGTNTEPSELSNDQCQESKQSQDGNIIVSDDDDDEL